jgi:hypothetical protein
MGSPVKAVGDLVGDVGKVVGKIIPNEIKPVLPFAAAALPFLAPELLAGIGGLTGAESPFLQRIIGGGAVDLLSQASQSDFNKRGYSPLEGILSAGTAGLTTPGLGDTLRGMQTASGIANIGSEGSVLPNTVAEAFKNNPGLVSTLDTTVSGTTPSFLDTLQNTALKSGAYLSDLTSKGVKAVADNGIFSKAGLTAIAPSEVFAASKMAANKAADLLDEYNAQQAGLGNKQNQNKTDTISYVTQNMKLAGFSDTAIQNALAQLNLGGSGISQSAATQYAINQPLNYPGYSLPSNIQKTPVSITDVLAQAKSPSSVLGYGAADGGIMGYAKGGKVKHAERLGYMFGNFVDPAKAQAQAQANQNEIESTYRGYLDRGPISPTVNSLKTQLANKYRNKGDLQKQYTNYLTTAGFKPEQITGILGGAQSLKKGGKANKQESDMIDLHGHEMDYRAAGGFVPIGKKERADDVPARLSKNEFVFTAKAVRNAGGGDIKEGAKRMYHIMKQLEARS